MTRMLREALRDSLGDEAGRVWGAFDQIGDVVVVRIPAGMMHRRAEIGRALLDGVGPARAVFCQVSPVGGERRTRDLERIAGEGGTRTEYRESGCRLAVDAGRAYFTPRLSTERARIAGLVRPGEVVLNMFGGTGAFSIIAARDTECTVYNVDINPDAIDLCGRSIAMNRTAGVVVPVLGDAAEVSAGLPKADRILMPLPEGSDGFLGAAAGAAAAGCTIHYYTHVAAARKQEAGRAAEARLAGAYPGDIEVVSSRTVRAVGPRYYQAVVDARVPG